MIQGSTVPIRIELPTPFAVGPVNSYLFTDPEPILIDTGVDSEESWHTLLDGLEAHGVAVSDLKKIIITHPHSDHFGQAYKLLEQSDAQVWIADLGAEWLLDPSGKFQKRIDFYRDYFLPQVGADEQMTNLSLNYMTMVRDSTTPLSADRVTQFKVGDMLRLGQLLWRVDHTPGHASHQTCFYQADTKQYISADMLLPITPTPLVECPPDGKTRQPSLPLFLESLAIVEQMAIETVFPGHGEPFDQPNSLIARQRSRIHQRKDECLGLVVNGVDTAVNLMHQMYAKYPAQLRTAGLWMLIGYLDLLIAEDKVEAWQEGELIRYKVK